MQTFSAANAQDILNVTAQSVAKHCGLTSNEPDDVQTEEIRGIVLTRQLGLVQSWPQPRADALYCEFSAKYLPALITKYKSYMTPCNIAATMINAICHLPYFIRYQRTPEASNLAVLQATRLANAVDDISNPQEISESCHFLATLLALQGTTAIPEYVKKKLVSKFGAWRRQYRNEFPGETSNRCYQLLRGTREMAEMSKIIKDMLERPLEQCGAQGCDRLLDSLGSGLKRCGRCKSAVYCGATHQKQHWAEHKQLCYPATF